MELKGVTLKLNQDVECVEKDITTFGEEIKALKDGDVYVLPSNIVTDSEKITASGLAMTAGIESLVLEYRDSGMSVTLLTNKSSLPKMAMFLCTNTFDGDRALKLRDYDVNVYNDKH